MPHSIFALVGACLLSIAVTLEFSQTFAIEFHPPATQLTTLVNRLLALIASYAARIAFEAAQPNQVASAARDTQLAGLTRQRVTSWLELVLIPSAAGSTGSQ